MELGPGFSYTQAMSTAKAGRSYLWLVLLPTLLSSGVAQAQARIELTGMESPGKPSLQFVTATNSAGLISSHSYTAELPSDPEKAVSGVAAGDIDGNGFIDLYVVRGDVDSNYLFLNQGDGTFRSSAAEWGVNVFGERGSGPSFADFDGDGWLDLFLGGVDGSKPRLFRNVAGQRFEEMTSDSGIQVHGDTFSSSLADYDRDGDVDLFLTHWSGGPHGGNPTDEIHLWSNDGDGTFTGILDSLIGLDVFEDRDFSLTGNFADINNDGWLDLLVAADFGTSQVFLSNRDGTFRNVTDREIITDENGMGVAIGDYDHDGDLDWFVSSIYDEDRALGWGVTGNRMYKNRGDGSFEDATDEAGVRIGYWGWGSCFADFDNDGNIDLFHVNGFQPLQGREGFSTGQVFLDDPSRLFLSNGDGSFSEVSQQVGILDRGQGRGVVCFDYDRDGDIDLFVANNSDSHQLYRNDLEPGHNYLGIRLRAPGMNREAVGARVYVTAGSAPAELAAKTLVAKRI